MQGVNLEQAKSSLSRLVTAIEHGQEREIVITHDGQPAAKLVGNGGGILKQNGPRIVGDRNDSCALEHKLTIWTACFKSRTARLSNNGFLLQSEKFCPIGKQKAPQ